MNQRQRWQAAPIRMSWQEEDPKKLQDGFPHVRHRISRECFDCRAKEGEKHYRLSQRRR